MRDLDNQYLVSIIMPCYNSARYIDEAVNSVLAQTHENWELLICDDGSTDNSRKKINDWASCDSRIKSVKNIYTKGAPGARNSCLNVSNGRYIAFLDSDDRWMPKKLKTQLYQFQENDVYFTFSSYQCISEEGELLNEVMAPKKIGLNQLLLSNFIGCLTVVYDSYYFGKIEQPDILKRNDYALWLTMFRKFPEAIAVSVSEPLAEYRVNSYGLSSNKFDAIRYYMRVIREYGGVSYIKSFLLLPCYLALIFVKKQSPCLYNAIINNQLDLRK